ncbi:hypothetical protein A9Q99_00950 [Gammaproteobacteria bacterium 45_16_T64]|nr:hypothetical protein A9Q99_00950 [Gammaproteobacteria bacterium 45_16_T64]
MGRITTYLLFALLLVPFSVKAVGVELNSSIQRYDLGVFADYLEDPGGSLEIADIVSPQLEGQWVKNQDDTMNFAFSSSVYWIRVDFRSDFDGVDPWLFEIAFPLQDFIDFYVMEGERVMSLVKTGDRREFGTRPIEYRNFLFPLVVPKGSHRQVYIRLANTDGLHEPCPMILWSSTEFTLKHGERSVGLGIYFGIMVVMAFYNLFLYVSVRDKTYLYYVTYIFGFSFWLFSYYGFSFQYLWPNHPTLGNQSTIVLTSFWAIFMAQFVRSFLHSAEYLLWFDRLMKVYIFCMILTILVSFSGNYSIGIFSVIGFGFPACLAGIAAGIVSWQSGYRPARFFLLAWSTLLISLTIFCLKIAGILPSLWFIERSVQIGSAIEVILLSLGLADRINVLKKEKISAQKESIASYESNLRLRNDFIASISHELRTPMNAILGGIEVVNEKEYGGLDNPFDIIRSGAQDMMSLVDDILIHTEIQSGQLKLERQSAKVGAAMDKLVHYYGSLCKDRGLTFEHKVDEDVPAWIITDRHKLTVVLTKLLDNAVKFTEAGEVGLAISVGYKEGSAQIRCAVSDSGPGIPKEKHELIFDPFVQMEGGFTRRHGGMGIGLSICRRLAESLNGSLVVVSEKDRGSCFTLTFPLELGVQEKIKEIGLLLSSDLPILVVEDNLVNQKVIVKMLEKLGFSTLVANHGEEAISILEENVPSLILMDLQMPIMDGFSCTSVIRQSTGGYKDIPIVAVTANVMDVDRARCSDIKMNDFLEKPVKLNVLRECLSKYVDF